MKPSSYFEEAERLTLLHRVSARSPGLRPLEAALDVRTLWPQRSVVHGPRPSFWRFAALPDPRKDPRHSLFRIASGASSVLSTSAAASMWLQSAGTVSDRLVAAFEAAKDDPVAQSELGAWKKLTLQAGHPIFSHIPSANVEPRYLAIPPDFCACLRHVVGVYRDAYDRYLASHGLPVDRPDPSNTSGGFPLFVTHPAAKVAGAALGYHDGSYDRTWAAAARWCERMGLPSDFALANGMGFRSGPVYKWQPIWTSDGSGGWRATHEWRGYAQRRRIIQMSPYPVNRLLRPFFSMLHAARTMIPGLWRTRNEDAEHVTGHKWHYEADISGYDLSVQLQLQALVAATLSEVWPAIGPAARTWLSAEQRGLIGPSWRLNPSECSYVSSIGATSSGLKPTAEIGTLIATACTRYALHLQGDDYHHWPHSSTFVSLHQGDDARVAGPDTLDAESWQQAFASIGLDCELIPGFTFLARLHMPNGALRPLSGRLVQQTMSNEHEPKGVHALGLLYLGFLARTELAHNCDPRMLDVVWSLIRDADWVASIRRWYGVTDVLSLREHLASHPHAQAVIKASISAAASDSWLLGHAREADRSPTSRMIAALAEERGWHLSRFISADFACESVCNAVSSLAAHKRDDLLARLTDAAFSGKHALDEQWAALLSAHGH